MNARIRTLLITNGLWLGGLTLLLVVLVGGSVYRLQAKRAAVAQAAEAIEQQKQSLKTQEQVDAARPRVEKREAVLAGWQSLLENPSERLDRISTAAMKSGVSLTSVRHGARDTEPTGLSVATDRIGATGSYRQVATFLDLLVAGSGTTALDRIRMKPDNERPGQLEVFLQVTWYAPGSGASSTEAGP